jgi:hypothetical protein
MQQKKAHFPLCEGFGNGDAVGLVLRDYDTSSRRSGLNRGQSAELARDADYNLEMAERRVLEKVQSAYIRSE